MHLYKMQTSRDRRNNPCLQHLELPLRSLHHSGLQDLTLVPHHPQSPLSHLNNPSSSSMLSDLLSPTLSPGLISGDYIGVESCVDVLREGDEEPHCHPKQSCYNQKVKDKREEKRVAMRKRMELPPPIPMLAQTENLHSHMPWVLKRHYTSDGRLILTEEKVRHHEYFRAHRSNGRLTLQLVPLGDEVLPPPFAANQKEAVDAYDDDDNLKNEKGDYYNESDDGYSGDEEEEEKQEEDEQDDDNLQFDDGVPEDPISTLKCFSFNSVGTGSPCIFGVPVPVIRHVHS
ncbi:hypothetical protein ACLB2K_051048 [Fragaria x ananassa]